MNLSNISALRAINNKILFKKVGKNMYRKKAPVVFEVKNLEKLISDLNKKDLENLIQIIQNEIKKLYCSNGNSSSKNKLFNNDVERWKTSKEVKDAIKQVKRGYLNRKYATKEQMEKYTLQFKNLERIWKMDVEILRGRFKNDLKCPKCGHFDLNKNGKTNNRQRYICKNCKRTFDERSFSPLSNTKLSLDTWLEYCRFMIEGGTIKYCAQKVSVSIPTSFFMRHRILDVLNLSLRNQTFEGLISADEYFLNESFKGKSYKKSIDEERYFKNFEYENLPNRGGWIFMNINNFLKNPEKHIKPIQVKINTAIDRSGHVLTRIVENPNFIPYSKEKCQDIVSFFENRVKKNATLCAFSQSTYRHMTMKLNIRFKKAISRMDEAIYTVHHVFMYHNKLSKWLANFHGVATKYLNNYLAWYSFLFMAKKINKNSRINDLFMEFATKTLSITKKQIQNRKVETI